MRGLPALLLLLGAQRHLLYGAFDAERAHVWNLCGAIAVSGLVLIVWRLESSAKRTSLALAAVALWILYEETLVGACSVFRAMDWWPIADGEGNCTKKIEVKAVSFSLVALGSLITMVSKCRQKQQ